MKIVHILLGKANPERMNGVNKIAHQLACAQVEEGMDVTICGLTKKKSIEADRPYDLQLFEQSSHSFSIVKQLKDFLVNLPENTVVHFHGVLIPVYASIAKILQDRSISYVVTPHGALQPMALEKNRILKKIYYYVVERNFLNNAKKVQAITAYEQKILKLLTTAPIALISNAYPYKPLSIDITHNAETIFGYIGRLDIKHKGLNHLINGFANFYRNSSQGCLWLIGDGKDRQELEKMATACGLSERILFMGEKHAESKHGLLTKIDIFMSPSNWDVLPTGILEAAAYAKPLLVTEATGFGDDIRKYEAGIVIDKACAVKITSAMLQISNLPFKNMGLNAEKMVKEAYNWSKVVKEITLELYQ